MCSLRSTKPGSETTIVVFCSDNGGERWSKNWPLIGENWPLEFGDHDLLYDVTIDGREAAEVSSVHPGVVADLRDKWLRIDAGLLRYPPDHPDLPPESKRSAVLRSQPD